jgi:branched-chain amino acid transport system substrate-binding protein
MKSTFNFTITTVLFVTVSFLFQSCKTQDTENEIRIGEYASLSGSEASFGTSCHNGIQLAVEEVNNAGGVLGKQINLITEDNQSKASEVPPIVQKLITREKVVAVLGEVASSNSIAGAPICQQNKIPMVTPASTNPEVTKIGDYIFRVCFIDPFQATVMSKFATNSMKVKRVAMLVDQKSAYSMGLAESFRKVFTDMGGEIIDEQKYSKGDKDFKAQLTSIKAKDPEAVFIPGYYTDVNLIGIQAREIGLNVPLFGGDGWDSELLTEGKAKDALEGSFFSTHVSADNPDPNIQGFIKRYRDRFGKEPDAMSFLGYDGAIILFDAIKRAGSTEGDKIRDALATIKDFPGVTGSITINEERNAVKPAVVMEVKDGKFVYKETIAP